MNDEILACVEVFVMDRLRQFSAKDRLLHCAMAFVFICTALPIEATPLEQAKRIHDRLAGVPPDATTLNKMQLALQGLSCNFSSTDLGNSTALGGVSPCTPLGAAYLAMSNKAFYNATLKNWISPWTNRDDDKFAPLNDYTATVIGVIRDGEDYRKILWEDILYVPVGFGSYGLNNNNAYAALEAADADMGKTSFLTKTTQQAVTGTATAGVMTTRAAARAFFIDGTNRAMFRFTLKNHLCNDMEQAHDITRPADRIRQDVTRSPGGDSRVFMNTCVGCHSGMDPMAQAFAYYNFNYKTTDQSCNTGNPESGCLAYTSNAVQPKYFINDNHFPEGYVTPDDRWDNYWRSGPNTAIFGWDSGLTGTGHGAKTLGTELANSQAFAVCSVKKVFKVVCLRDPMPSPSTDAAAFASMLSNFNSSHNLKHTFAEAAVHCSGL